MKKILAITMALLMLFMSSCAAKDSSVNTDTTADDKKDTAKETTAKIEFFKTDEEVFEIETDYIALKFPVKFKDCVNTTVIEADGAYSVVFTAYLDETSLGLFTIIFADDEDSGYCAGAVKTKFGVKNVYVVSQYDEYCENLSEDSKYTYYQMCEDVNVIVSKLVYDDGMEIAN